MMMIFVTLACVLNGANCKAPTQNGSTNNQHYGFESLASFEQKKIAFFSFEFALSKKKKIQIFFSPSGKIHQKKVSLYINYQIGQLKSHKKKRVSRTFDAITEYLSKNSQKIKKTFTPLLLWYWCNCITTQ
jgi:hypothetical protein